MGLLRNRQGSGWCGTYHPRKLKLGVTSRSSLVWVPYNTLPQKLNTNTSFLPKRTGDLVLQ